MTLTKAIVIASLIALPPIQAQTPRAYPYPQHTPFPPYGSYPRALAQHPSAFDVQALSGRGSYLGVGLLKLDAERAQELKMESPSGVEISSVAKDSPAEDAGLLKTDVIIEFRGETVVGTDHFVRLVRETPVGRKVPVRVWRGGAETDLTVTVGRRREARRGVYSFRLECDDGEDCHHPGIDFTMPSFDFDMPRPRMVLKSRVLGAELEGLKNKGQLASFFGIESGALVRSVDAGSPAARVGLQAGDVIISVDGKPVDNAKKVSRLLRSAGSDKPVAVEVMRNRAKKTLTLEASRRGSDDSPSRRRGKRVRVQGSEKL